ncbi:hypothetical protein JCM10207_005082 [Rhodosporidiobolus poonsookiae]
MSSFEEHPAVVYDTPLVAPGHKIRAVLLGQHPTRVTALAGLLNETGVLQVVAGCSDILDGGVILNAQIPPVDLLICGGYFELQDVRDMLAEVANDKLRLLKVPDGLMMEGGGPPAVRDWLLKQIEDNRYTPAR